MEVGKEKATETVSELSSRVHHTSKDKHIIWHTRRGLRKGKGGEEMGRTQEEEGMAGAEDAVGAGS